MANEEHLAILKQGVDAWNAWRKENPEVKPDLGGAELSGTDLAGADLSEAKLRGAKLSWAYLEGANLYEAGLSVAGLGGADLSWAYLEGANLRGADLSEADLSRANLSGVLHAEANGSAVVDVWAAAEPPGGALRGGATQRVPWRRKSPALRFSASPIPRLTESLSRGSAAARRSSCAPG